MNWPGQLALAGVALALLAIASVVAAIRLLDKPVDIAPPDEMTLLVVPVSVGGDKTSFPDEDVLTALIEDLRRSLDLEYVIGEPFSLPGSLLNRQTGQLRVDLALSAVVRRYRRSGYFRVLCVTARDVTIPNYNFLFGLADAQGFGCVMSIHRLGWGADEALTRERIAKIALHEIGHTLGRGHTPDIKSVMVYSDSLSELDESGSYFTPFDLSIILTKIPELAGRIKAGESSDSNE